MAQPLKQFQHTAYQSTHTEFEPVLLEWQDLLGKQNVSSKKADLDRYACTCGGHDRYPRAILKPANQQELINLLKIARENSVAIYPISRGKNWGYGSAAPTAENCVIVDLSRMNRIIKIDKELAYVVIEPGVTQEQLYDYIKHHAPNLYMDATGASPQASIIGNLVERGFGQTPYSDRFMHSAGMEILLSDGRILQTGFGRFEGAKTTHLFKWGIGPFLDGIFTQSNFGIVTKVGIWLMPKPQCQGVLLIRFKTDQELLRNIDSLRTLKLRGLLPSAVHIVNDLRVISTLQGYPFQEMNQEFPLSEQALAKLRRTWGVGAWNCVAGIQGSKRQVRAALKDIREQLGSKVTARFISDSLINFLERHDWLYKVFASKVKPRLALLDLVKGIPTNAALRGMYWRVKQQPENSDYDPIRDDCGLLWISPVIPMTADDLEHFTKISRRVFEQHKLETNIAVSLLAERALCCTVGIAFDRSDATQLELAQSCHRALAKAYFEAGYPPYRMSNDSSAYRQTQEFSVFEEVCSQLKKVLDPDGIIAPLRYGIK
ncbi:MAG: FAD-binding oxidoreductase [Bdellovibrionales bacterium]|nr:FAD-binding oxidoreductase [Bdellovibrionales bacterium]